MIINKRILIKTENEYFQVIYDLYRNNPNLIKFHRITLGLDIVESDGPIYIQRGIAGLLLFLEVARILQYP